MKPLHNQNAEICLLGSIFHDPTALDRIEVTADDFADTYLGQLYTGFVFIFMNSGRSHISTIQDDLERVGVKFDASTFGKLYESVGTGHHATSYAQIIQDLAKRRRAIDSCQTAVRALGDVTEDVDGIVNILQKSVSTVAGYTAETRWMRDNISDVLAELQVESSRRSVPTGFATVDDLFGRLQASELTTLAARPGGGKTTFGLQVAGHNAERGRRVLYVSLEMSYSEFTKRFICIQLGLDSRDIREGKPSTEVLAAISNMETELADDFPFALWAPGKATIAQIESRARAHNAQYGLDLLVVDHLQIVKANDVTMQRYQQLGEITADLKALAKDLDIPVLLQSQVARADTQPTLSSLRESGDIEQNSDNVWFLHREQESESIKFIAAKFRHGTPGSIEGFHLGQGGRLVDPAYVAPNESLINV